MTNWPACRFVYIHSLILQMKKTFLSLLALAFSLFIPELLSAQITWEKLFSKKSTDVFRDVAEVPAGGYILAGYTADSSVNDTDAYVVRMNLAGDTLWTRRYNGPNSGKDLLYKVINTSDGGFVFCGYSTSFSGGFSDDAFWMKMDSNGNIIWTQFWGGTGRDRAQDIIQTSDGGFAIAGYTTSSPAQYFDAMLLKTNSAGVLQWSKLYGTSVFDDANTLLQLPDGGYMLGGQSTNGANGLDMYMVRTNPNGDTLWTKKFGTAAGTDNIESIIRLSDGSYILAGGTDNPGGLGGNDGNLVKTDSSGTVLWSKIYGGNSQDDFHKVFRTTDGGFILSGTSRSYGPPVPAMWMMKTNANGDSTWSRIYGGLNHDHGYAAVQTLDGGYIFTGYSSSFGFNYEEAYVVKTNSTGGITDFLTYTSVSAVVTPNSGTCGSAGVNVRVIVRNFGRDTVPNVPVNIQITGALTQTLNQTYSGALHPNDADTLMFTTSINTSGGGILNFLCTTSNNNDVYPKNNTYQTSVYIPIVNPAPSGTNGARCGTGSVMLGASGADTVFWYNAPSGGTLLGSGSTFNTPSISSTTIYYAQTGSTCPSATRTAVTASILTQPSPPSTTSAQRCGNGTVTLTASASDPVRWFTALSGGTQVGTGNSFTTPTLSSTTVYYAEAYNAGCGSSRVSATATINPQSADPSGGAASRCGPGTLALTVTASDPVTWYDAQTGGNVIGTGNSYNTPSLSSTTTYYAQASNGTCPSNLVAVTATIHPITPDPSVTGASRCGPGTVGLSASSSDILIWYPTSSGGTQLGIGPNFTTPFINSSTTYYVQATNGLCPSAYIPVQAVINSNPSVNLGPDTVYIFSSSHVLDAGAGFSQYAWTGGSTSQTLNITSSGSYCVTVTDANACTATDCIFVELITSINSGEDLSRIEIYPNPSTGRFAISYPETAGLQSIMIISSDGKIVAEYSANAGAGKTDVDLYGISSGVYFVKIVGRESSVIRRVLIK
ncbi:MAG: T9SS C-terminal target domain-containing protein [Bacteroidetes bacterium]|nr:MAG: T9SS C-terminal target domain-containing protein [Bacteroidota bacterium]